MKKVFRVLLFLFFIALFTLSCVSSRHDQRGVESAMKHYDHLILQLDVNGIAKLFMPLGNLGNIAIGRDSIKKFLSSFKNVKVLSQASVTSSIKINNDTAFQAGHYNQSDLIAGKDTVYVKGTYQATWQWVRKKGWLIQKMTTKPG